MLNCNGNQLYVDCPTPKAETDLLSLRARSCYPTRFSALTMLELDELKARYASHDDLSTLIRHRFTDPKQTLEELFGRMVFNILVGNTDDHARNHAAFWDGQDLILTPAYAICPQGRTGGEATQAMLITANKRLIQLTFCMEAARFTALLA
jgi:serine/threonine-protein kinase HipA